MSLLEVKGLCKSYGDFRLRDISFTLEPGYIMGYVGPNGAGKTTTLSSITRLIRPDSGEVYLDGHTFEEDPVAFRGAIGYVGDSSYLPADLSPRQLGWVFKDFYPGFDPEKYRELLTRWELPERKITRDFSRGMKVKLMFAAVLSRPTKLLILDEATGGLDPLVRREVLRLLQNYIEDGQHSVLFSTHIMEDLQDIADYLYLIDRGETILLETREALQEKYMLLKGPAPACTPELKAHLIGLETSDFGFSALIETDKAQGLSAEIVTEQPGMDEIVVRLLSERARLR